MRETVGFLFQKIYTLHSTLKLKLWVSCHGNLLCEPNLLAGRITSKDPVKIYHSQIFIFYTRTTAFQSRPLKSKRKFLLPFAVVIFCSMALFWDLPTLPCAYIESPRHQRTSKDPKYRTAGNNDNRMTLFK